MKVGNGRDGGRRLLLVYDEKLPVRWALAEPVHFRKLLLAVGQCCSSLRYRFRSFVVMHGFGGQIPAMRTLLQNESHFTMRNSALVRRIEIVRSAKDMPAAVCSAEAEILECDILRTKAKDWVWLKNYVRGRKRLNSRRHKACRAALRSFVGKPLISASVAVKNSVFLIFVDPEERQTVFWEERRWVPSGRMIRRYFAP